MASPRSKRRTPVPRILVFSDRTIQLESLIVRHRSLEKACEILGISSEQGQKLLDRSSMARIRRSIEENDKLEARAIQQATRVSYEFAVAKVGELLRLSPTVQTKAGTSRYASLIQFAIDRTLALAGFDIKQPSQNNNFFIQNNNTNVQVTQQQVTINQLVARMNPEELYTYSTQGALPGWFNEAIATLPSP